MDSKLKDIRARIDAENQELFLWLKRRVKLSIQAQERKKDLDLAKKDDVRENEMLAEFLNLCKENDFDESVGRSFYLEILNCCRDSFPSE